MSVTRGVVAAGTTEDHIFSLLARIQTISSMLDFKVSCWFIVLCCVDFAARVMRERIIEKFSRKRDWGARH